MKNKSVLSPLLLCSLLVVSGIIMGILGLKVLSPDEKAELLSYLEVFMRGFSAPELEPGVIFRLSLVQNLKICGLFWAFGLAIIGVPLTCIMLFIRGFAVGFSSAFVLKEVVSNGFLVFLSGIFPHNVVFLPSAVLLSAMSVSFSLTLIKDRPWVHGGLLKLCTGYTWRFALTSLILFLSSFIEAYISPVLLKKVAGYF